MMMVPGVPSGEGRSMTGTMPTAPRWLGDLARDERSGRIIENIPNVGLVLTTDPRWEGVFKLNLVHRRIFVHRELPGALVGDEIVPRPLQDFDIEQCQMWMQGHGGMLTVGKETVFAAIRQTSKFFAYHPIKDYFDGLVWDGRPRLDTLLVRYCGAEDTPYVRKIARLFMVGMVRRMWWPGSKMDYMLVLEGAQGIGKSTIAKILAGEDFFGEAHFKDLESSDTSLFLRNKWVVEFGEMHALRKSEINELKMWLTKQAEDYRPKYGRENVIELRQCVFIGTSNSTEYLNDNSGARRFWPVLCRFADTAALALDRDQIIAEALVAMHAGESNFPEREFELEHFAEQQAQRRLSDPWMEFIEPLTKKFEFLYLDVICRAIRLERSKVGRIESERIKDCMLRLGWEPHRTNATRGWRPKRADPVMDILNTKPPAGG
jgi:predicted P-loop ATPase